MKHRIIFIGEVLPRTGSWYFEEPVWARRDDEMIQIVMQESVIQIRVDTDGPEEIDDSWLERVWLRCLAPARASLDILGFHLGATLELQRLTALLDDETVVFFRTSEPRFRFIDDGRVGGDVVGTYFYEAMTNPPFRHALADVRQAQRLDDDAAFYSYRAIEGLRQLFLREGEPEEKDRAKSWERLRSALDVTKDDIGEIAAAAKARRHGGDDSTEIADRLKHVQLTKELIVRYVNQTPKASASSVPDVAAGFPTQAESAGDATLTDTRQDPTAR